MGALIQTKGTRLLAKFFNNDRFSGTGNGSNIVAMRTIPGLTASFGSGMSLFDISEAFEGQWADGSDVLYPSVTVKTVSASPAGGSATLNFTAALPAVVVAGMAVADETHPNAIKRNTTVSVRVSNTQLTLSNANTNVTAGDAIIFSDGNHPNLIKRWKYYLKTDLSVANHAAIRVAIFEALMDPSFDHIQFQSIEADTQSVLRATEFNAAANGGTLDLTTKHKQVVLLTPRTTAPDPIDPQT